MLPDRFIPLAERSGLIRSLTLFAARTALRQARTWREAGIELTVVGQPLDARPDRRLAAGGDRASCSRRRACPRTCSSSRSPRACIMADPMRARGVLTRLRGMGVKVAIDDFGIGLLVARVPEAAAVNDLKIDKSFVINMMEDSGDAVIVQSTIDLAHNLGLTVDRRGGRERAGLAPRCVRWAATSPRAGSSAGRCRLPTSRTG